MPKFNIGKIVKIQNVIHPGVRKLKLSEKELVTNSDGESSGGMPLYLCPTPPEQNNLKHIKNNEIVQIYFDRRETTVSIDRIKGGTLIWAIISPALGWRGGRQKLLLSPSWPFSIFVTFSLLIPFPFRVADGFCLTLSFGGPFTLIPSRNLITVEKKNKKHSILSVCCSHGLISGLEAFVQEKKLKDILRNVDAFNRCMRCVCFPPWHRARFPSQYCTYLILLSSHLSPL